MQPLARTAGIILSLALLKTVSHLYLDIAHGGSIYIMEIHEGHK